MPGQIEFTELVIIRVGDIEKSARGNGEAAGFGEALHAGLYPRERIEKLSGRRPLFDLF